MFFYSAADSVFILRPDGSIFEYSIDNDEYISITQKETALRFENDVYKLFLPNNVVEMYGSNGRLIAIESQQDVTSISYRENIITIEKNGYLIDFHIEDNRVIQISSSSSTLVNYNYSDVDGLYRLESAEYEGGSSLTYVYNDARYPHYVTNVIDQNGNYISSVQYDDQGRAISSEKGPLNSGVERTQVVYLDPLTSTVTNALGKQNTYHFTQFNGEYKMTQVEGHASDNCAAANQAYTYDSKGFLESKTDWQGNITTYVHNDRGQELSRTEASGTPQARTITTEWHSEFNLPTKITEPEREIVMTYDSNGHLLSRNIQSRSL